MAELIWRADNIETIAGFFSATECDAYIRLGEAIGFDAAPISTSTISKAVRPRSATIVA